MIKYKVDMFLKALLNLTVIVGIIYIFMIISSCDDNIYVGGYNKDMKEIHQQMFEVDLLIRTISLELDSLNAKGY